MEEIKIKIQKIFDLVGFDSVRIEINEEEHKVSISIKDRIVSPARLPELVSSLTHLIRRVTKREAIHVSKCAS